MHQTQFSHKIPRGFSQMQSHILFLVVHDGTDNTAHVGFNHYSTKVAFLEKG